VYRLDRMEIHGFKSFCDRTEVVFPVRITAVVGPNGCGKSNISDAIHWVLGEQRVRTLRGEKMEDVIFNGAERRKPLGMAEVSLFLALDPNTEPLPAIEMEAASSADPADALPAPPDGSVPSGPEDLGAGLGPEALLSLAAGAWPESIRITRRLFRDGQSDYLLDGARCRLRDVQDVLRRVSVGSGASSIIEQGKVDQIVASKPKDRRVLIEEAAGIAGFKAKKREAMLKLEATEANLVRLEDILGEVRRQIGGTKRQAAKARRYRRLMEERRHLERISFRQRGEELATRLATLDAELRASQDEEAASSARLAEASADAERLRAEVDEGEQGLTDVRDAVHALDLQVGREEHTLEAARRQAQEQRVASVEAEGEAGELEGRAAQALAEAGERELASAGLADEVRVLAAEAEAREAALAIARGDAQGMEAGLEARRTDLLALLERAADLRGRLSRLEQERGRAEVAAARATAEAVAAGEEQRRLARQAAELDSEAETVARRAEMLDRGAATAASEAERLRDEVSACEGRAEAARHARVGHAERLEALLATEREQSAQGRSARAAGADAAGVVADFVRPAHDLEEAAEAYLGDLLPAVLVRDEAALRRALDALRSSGEGRGSFLLPVSSGTTSALPDELRSDPRVRGRLADLLGVEGAAADSVRASAEGALVVESLEAAIDLARRYPNRAFLTLNGEVVRPGGLITGGRTADLASGILKLRRRIVEAREGEAREGRIAEEAAAAGSALRAQRDEVEQRRQAMARERSDLAVSAASLAERQRAVRDQLERTDRLRDVRAAEAEKERGDHGASIQEIGALAAELLAAEAARTAHDEGMRELTLAVERRREEVGLLGEEQAARRSRLEGAGTRLEAAAEESRRARDAAQEVAARAARYRDEAAQRLRSAADLDQLAQRSEAGLIQNLARREVEQRRLAEETERLAGVRERSSVRHQEAKAHQAAYEEVRARRTQADLLRSRAGSEREFLEQSCRGELDQSLAEVAAAVPDEELQRPADGIVQALADIRARIDALGPVNVMAMDQFTELEERNRFLTSQQQDLLGSIRSLKDTISRINRRSRERFLGAFEQIRTNFAETYRVLFGGGRADLHLEEEAEDVLECGVEIIAQPPGKRLQRIALLSGGERALTAIALLFAIFRHRPSPFCVLDEVDAPLDEANVHRYTDLLKRMSEETQFVLITHNKRTMEKADALYGVTMQEPGVSRLVSVRFSEEGRIAAADGSGEIDLEAPPARRTEVPVPVSQ
jgi:chromosome segregation protein